MTLRPLLRSMMLAAGAALAMVSCEELKVITVSVARLEVSPEATSVEVNETRLLSATVRSAAGDLLSGRTIEWRSLDEPIAVVANDGTVRGIAPGVARIRASSEGASADATVTVMSSPALAVAPNAVQFNVIVNGANPGDRSISITNAGTGTLSGLSTTVRYTAGQSTGWLAASLAGTTAPTTLLLSASHAGLPIGIYSATVDVASSVAGVATVPVAVTLTVAAPPPAIALGVTTVAFSTFTGGADPAAQTVGVSNAGGGTLSGLAAAISYATGQPTGWLTATLTSGTAPTTLSLRPTLGTLAQGVYRATVHVSSATAQNSPQAIEVTFTVGPAQPTIGVRPASLDFAATIGRGNPAAQTVQVENAGGASVTGLSVSVTYPGGQPSGWLSTGLSGSTAPATLTVAAATGSLPAGTYTATVQVSSPVAANSPQLVAVTFVVQNPPPAIGLSMASINFSTTVVADPTPTMVTVDNSGGGTLSGLSTTVSYAQGEPTNWLTATLSSTTAPATLTLNAQRATLGPGTYNATVSVLSSVPNVSPADVAVAFTVNQGVPAAPYGLATVLVSERQIDLTWIDNSTTESTFQIHRNAGGVWSVVGSVGPNQNSFSDVGLASSTTYSHRVAACNTSGCSPFAGPVASTTAPAVPTGLTATVSAATKVDLKWSDNSPDETGFPIERSTNNGQSWAVITTAAAGATSFSDTNAPPSTALLFRLRACRNAVCSGYSAPVSATTGIPVPATPTGLSANAVSTSRIDLAWTGSAGGNVTEYRIERKTGPGGTYAQIAVVPSGQTAYQDQTGLSASTTYFYRVLAANGAGTSGYSNEVSARTADPAAPAAPSNLTATAASATQVNLSWSDNSTDETGFPVERSSDGGQSWGVIATAAAGATSFSDPNASPATTYHYRVRACRNAVCSAYTATAQATTPAIPPAAPSGLTANAVSTSQIDLTWTASATGNPTEYRIERKTGAGGSYTQLAVVAGAQTSYQDKTLSASTTYFYQVRAANSAGTSGYSNEVSASTPALPPPAAPSNLTATAVSPTQVNLSWSDNSTDETEFPIERSTDGGQSWGVIATAAAGATSFSDTNVSQGSTYHYRVRACRNAVCSGYTTPAPATTPVLPPAAPSGLTATAVSTSQIDLSWSASASGNPTEYRIERKTGAGGTYAQIAVVAGAQTSYQDKSLSASTTYFYQVRAANSGGTSGYSNEASASTPAPLAPDVPTNLTASGTSASQINLSWTTSGLLVTHYDIERDGIVIATVLGTSTSYTDTGLPANNTLQYRVRACTLTACSAWSAAVSGTTFPGEPTAADANYNSSTGITVSWQPHANGQTRFEIRRRIRGGSFPQGGIYATVAGSSTAYVDTALVLGTEYQYQIRACNVAGCSDYVDTGFVNTQNPLN